MLIFGLATIPFSSMIVRAPIRFVVPTVLSLTMFGAFALRNNIFDVLVVAIVGGLGFFLEKVGVKWVPIALGLVLGSLIESSFQHSLLIAPTRGGNLFVYWMTRPLTVAMVLLVVLMLVSAVRRLARRSRKPLQTDAIAAEDLVAQFQESGVVEGIIEVEEAESIQTEVPEQEKRWLNQRMANIIVGVGLLLMAAHTFYEMAGWRARARNLPLVLVVLLTILAVALLVVNLTTRLGRANAAVYPFTGVSWRRWSLCVVGLVIVAFFADNVGFYESIFIFMFAVTANLSRIHMSLRRAPVQSTLFTICAMSILYLIFKVALSVPTPDGLFIG
jgi:hypothetical protein